MIAHIRSTDSVQQSVMRHSGNTATLSLRTGKSLGLGYTAFLIGLLHDMGKCTKKFNSYIRISAGLEIGSAEKYKAPHSPCGALYAYENWYSGDIHRKLTAQLISMTIYAHHSGLPDIFNLKGESPYFDGVMREKDNVLYNEAVGNYLNTTVNAEFLNVLFNMAVAEITAVIERLKEKNNYTMFSRGLLLKELLSILIDADRFDSACFEYNTNPFEKPSLPNWNSALDSLDRYIDGLGSGKLSEIRQKISDSCLFAAESLNRVFRLTVPTGGGKTFSSLRFALRRAQLDSCRRIFYVIPFNTILDQNAKDMQQALGASLMILEHHSNVVLDENDTGEIENYRRLTERWTDCDLILTSIVQFMNCVYTNRNSHTRRMCRLSESVIVFDEIQALPKKCTALFEKLIDYLTNVCFCTVVLCTATQPEIELKTDSIEMYPHPQELWRQFKRAELIDESTIPLSTEQASRKAFELVCKHGEVLMIVNTKKMAKIMHEKIKALGITSLHLSTDMTPEHRMSVIEKIKNRDKSKPLFCVSTALIEAGINISFACVVRSFAGIDNTIQAMGRCNRNAELPEGTYGTTYIWNLHDENISRLPDILAARKGATGILKKYGNNSDSLEAVREYFIKERASRAELSKYPISGSNGEGFNTTLVDLLGMNKLNNSNVLRDKFVLVGAYRTAGECFNVIDSQTQSVLVNYGGGEQIYRELCSDHSMSDTVSLLRRASLYSVSLYRETINELERNNALIRLDSHGVIVLRGEFYDEETGVTKEPKKQDLLNL